MVSLAPLNGAKTHPMKPASIKALRSIAEHGPIPANEINPGVCNRLSRSGLVYGAMLASPYKTHKGKEICHLCVSSEGLDFLKQLDNGGDGHALS